MTRIINRIIIVFLRLTRPLLGFARCKFPISCTEFAIMQLTDMPLGSALRSIIKQLLLCNPLW